MNGAEGAAKISSTQTIQKRIPTPRELRQLNARIQRHNRIRWVHGGGYPNRASLLAQGITQLTD
jgi:hypothetical protein